MEVLPALTHEQLQQIVQQLLLHHDALRLQFVQLGENCQQLNAAAQETVPLSIIDLSHKKLQALPQAQVSFNYFGQFDQVLRASNMLGLAKELKAEQSLLNTRSHLLGVSGFIRALRLEMTWAYSEKVHKRATIECLALEYMEALKTLIAHCQLPDAIGHTPSDFSAARLSQKQLDKFLSKINKDKTRKR